MINEIDFTGYLGNDLRKTFTFTNDDDSLYDFSDTQSVTLKLYIDATTPLEIVGSISVVSSTITFIFLSTTHTVELGTFEYIIEETKTSLAVNRIGYGNFTVKEYLPFSETIVSWLNSELPVNLTLTEDYVNQRLFYWRNFLQAAFYIPDSNLNVESAWPNMVNSLLAKLVVYDGLELASRGSYIQFMGGSFQSATDVTGGGALKSVETGPTNVEYFDAAVSAKNAFTSSQGNISLFDSLKESLCGLSKFLKVKVPMCKGSSVTVSPKYYQNSNWSYPKLKDPGNVVSQG